jgi:type I restriction enzyme S subunit
VEAKALAPGVVTGRYGTLGEVFYIEDDYWPLNTALYVTDFKGNHPRFIAYLLEFSLRHYQSDKAAVPGVDRNVLHELTVRCPDLPVQQRIADVLSTYDDLITNNQRRMALLERAARELYREWFVRLQFPGREHARVTAGVPDRWERVPLGDRVTLHYGKAMKTGDRAEGACPVYGSSGVIGFHDKPLAASPGIVVGRKGNIGSVYWCPKDYWPIDTVFFIDAETSNLWLYYALQHMHFVNTDVAVPGLSRTFAYSRPLLIPDARVMRVFLEAVSPMHEQVAKVGDMNNRLQAARDLLLPRLMNGEIAA